MEQTLHSPEIYDFRRYDQIWQRVAPALEPYPVAEARGNGMQNAGVQNAGVQNTGTQEEQALTLRQESMLPGADPNPCCMGSAAMEMLEVLLGFLEEEAEGQRAYAALMRRGPVWARTCLRELAAEKEEHVRRLETVYYLITGTCRQRERVCGSGCSQAWCPALRERYHAEACNGLNYRRAADETADPCLSRLLGELSASAYCHADRLLRMLERGLVH